MNENIIIYPYYLCKIILQIIENFILRHNGDIRVIYLCGIQQLEETKLVTEDSKPSLKDSKTYTGTNRSSVSLSD